MSQACRASKSDNVLLDLTHEPRYQEGFLVSEPLRLATNGLKQWYRELLEKKRFSEADIQSVTLEFSFSPDRRDDYTCSCRCRLVTTHGKEFVHHQ